MNILILKNFKLSANSKNPIIIITGLLVTTLFMWTNKNANTISHNLNDVNENYEIEQNSLNKYN